MRSRDQPDDFDKCRLAKLVFQRKQELFSEKDTFKQVHFIQ